MNPDFFGFFGYVGLALSAGTLITWLAYAFLKKRIISNAAILLAVGAAICAGINSGTHMKRIAIDPSAQKAEMERRQQAKIDAALDSRGEEVAQIRFAEDAQGEYLDTAGMDETELKYIGSLTEDEEPEWKKTKKERSGSSGDESTLEDLIDDEPEATGANVETFEKEKGPEPILMSESDVVLARQIDGWNTKIAYYVLIIGSLLILIYDYLRRVNIYQQASFPLPLPSGLPNAITPIPPIVARPEKPRRSMSAELDWIRGRGDSFIYLTDTSEQADEITKKLAPTTKYQLLRTSDENITDEFIFESLWYNRSSFIVDSPVRAEQIIHNFIASMQKRRTTKARVHQTVHMVWDMDKPFPESLKEEFLRLADLTGFSLFLNQTPSSS